MRKTTHARIIVVLLALIPVTPGFVRAADGGVISGVVSELSGQPAAGAFVQAKNVEKGVTTTVISQDQGRFTISNLDPGKYHLRALGGGLKSDTKGAVTLAAGQKLTVEVKLTAAQTFVEASTAANEMALLPEGEGKSFIQDACGLCHRNGLTEILFRRQSKDGWMESLARMRNFPYGVLRSAYISDQERDMLVDYLAKNLNPDLPPLDLKQNLPKSWVKGPATKSVLVEVDLPKGSYPHDVAVDSHGVLWVSEQDLGYLGRLDPVTLSYTRYRVPVPVEKLSMSIALRIVRPVILSDALSIDANGHAWMIDSNNNTLFEFNPETESFSAFPYQENGGWPPAEHGIGANTIQFLPDGTLWFTIGFSKRVGKFDPATKQFTLYSANMTSTKGGPYGITADGAGNLWFPEQVGNTVGKMDPETGKATTYDPPTPNSTPRRIGADWDGNPWFAEYLAGNLVKIDFRTAKMTEYPTPTKYSAPYSVDSDKMNHFIWVNENFADQIARFEPRTKTWVEFPLPDHHLSIRKIAVDPTMPNRVWFGEPNTDRVGYLQIELARH